MVEVSLLNTTHLVSIFSMKRDKIHRAQWRALLNESYYCPNYESKPSLRHSTYHCLPEANFALGRAVRSCLKTRRWSSWVPGTVMQVWVAQLWKIIWRLVMCFWTTRPNFSQPSSRIAFVYQSFCSRTIADRLLYDWIAEKYLVELFSIYLTCISVSLAPSLRRSRPTACNGYFSEKI